MSSQEDEEVGRVERLIFNLYYNPESQTLANKELTLCQMSPGAWRFCWLLLSPTKPVEVQYFGANSIHLKISKHWSELEDDDQRIELRSILLETLCRYMSDGRGMKMVETKLCLALAAYCIKTSVNLWPTAIDDLVENFQPSNLTHFRVPTNKAVGTLIEILSLIPEEFNTIYMGVEERFSSRSSLITSAPRVFTVIKTILQAAFPVEVHQAAIRCWSNWSQNLGPLLIQEDGHGEILNLVLGSIPNPDLSPSGVEAINSIYSHPEIHKYPNSVLALASKLVQLEGLLNKALSEMDTALSTLLYSLFIHIGETHSRLFLEAVINRAEYREDILKLIQLILQCSATKGYYPVDETCSEQAFNFWYTFQDDIIASEAERMSTLLSLFHPLYQSLIETLLIKVQYPPDLVFESEWSSEDREAFRCYRQDIGDTFMYCYNMLRFSMLTTLLSHLHHALTQLEGNNRNWQHLEAVLFAFSSIAENVDIGEDEHLSQVFALLPQLPPTSLDSSPRLLSSLMEMFGAYSEWLYNHPTFLRETLILLVRGLESRGDTAVVSATMALKDITRECQGLLGPFSRDLLSACREALREESHLRGKERSRLMATVGQVLSTLPVEEAMDYLGQLLPPIIAKLQLGLGPGVGKGNIVLQLNLLSMLFATLDPDLKQVDPEEPGELKLRKGAKCSTVFHPGFPIFKEVLPLLSGLATRWSTEDTVMDALSDCIKRALSNLLDFAKPLVMDLIQLVSLVYTSSFQPSLLDILKQLMVLFGSDEQLQPYLISFYSCIARETINHVSKDVRDQSSLIEYFYCVSSVILRKAIFVFKSSELDSGTLFKFAMTALVLPEKPTVKSLSGFITEFILRSRENDAMLRTVNEEGEKLIGQVFNVIAGNQDSPRHVVECMADILMACNQKYFDNYCRWLGCIGANESPISSQRASIEEKEQFVKCIIKERKNKRKMKEFINQFALLSRGLINTEYGQQQIKLPY